MSRDLLVVVAHFMKFTLVRPQILIPSYNLEFNPQSTWRSLGQITL